MPMTPNGSYISTPLGSQRTPIHSQRSPVHSQRTPTSADYFHHQQLQTYQQGQQQHGWSASRGRYMLSAQDQHAAQSQRALAAQTHAEGVQLSHQLPAAPPTVHDGMQQRASLRSQPVGGRLAYGAGVGGQLQEHQRQQQLTHTGVVSGRAGSSGGGDGPRATQPWSSPNQMSVGPLPQFQTWQPAATSADQRLARGLHLAGQGSYAAATAFRGQAAGAAGSFRSLSQRTQPQLGTAGSLSSGRSQVRPRLDAQRLLSA